MMVHHHKPTLLERRREDVLLGLQDGADIWRIGKRIKQRNEVKELSVVWIVEPARDWDGVLGLEDIRVRAIVDNHCVMQFATQLCEVLHVVAAVHHARLAEETSAHELLCIQQVHERIRVLHRAG